MPWIDLAWEEFKLLQSVIDRQMSVRWHIRGSLLALQAALTVAVFTEKLPRDSFFWGCVAATVFAWLLEMVENLVIAQAITRQRCIEDAINVSGLDKSPPLGFRLPDVCHTLAPSAYGWPTVKYVVGCLIKPRRLLVLAIFMGLPVIVRFVLR